MTHQMEVLASEIGEWNRCDGVMNRCAGVIRLSVLGVLYVEC